MKVSVDVAGFNYEVIPFDVAVSLYKLNPIQAQLLKQFQSIYLENGKITLEREE